MGHVNSYEVYQVRYHLLCNDTEPLTRMPISWVDPNVTMDPYCDKPWAL